MLEKLKQETGLGSSFDYLGFEPGSEDYIKESLILKHLLPQSTYFVTENIANKFQIGKDIVTSTGDTLGIDQSTLNRMTAVATSHPYSNFLLVPNAKTIIFVTMAHKDDIEYAFTTRKYTAEGASLPVGVFATGSKNWNLEKPGQHASISASDLMKVFIPLL